MNGETHEERPHARFGPSSLKHFAECPGYGNRGGTNPAAEMGNRIHDAVERRDTSQLESELEVECYNDLVANLDAELAELEGLAGFAPVVMQEERLYMDLGAAETFGTADVVALAGRHALLWDAKTGVLPVDAPPENKQSLCYAIGVFQAYPQVETIKAVFSIPRRGENLEGYYHRSQLKEYIREVARILLLAEITSDKWETGAPSMHELVPCDSCIWCKYQDRCPALGYMAIDLARRYAPDILPAGIESVSFDEISDPAAQARLFKVAKIMEKWSKGFIYKTVAAACDGAEFPDLRLKSMGSPRKITDQASLIEVAAAHGISATELLMAADFSLKSLGELVTSRAQRGKKEKALRSFENDLEAHGALERGKERFTLASAADED